MMPCWIWWLLQEMHLPRLAEMQSMADIFREHPQLMPLYAERYGEYAEVILHRRRRRADPRKIMEDRMLEMSGMTQEEMDEENRRIWGPGWDAVKK